MQKSNMNLDEFNNSELIHQLAHRNFSESENELIQGIMQFSTEEDYRDNLPEIIQEIMKRNSLLDVLKLEVIMKNLDNFTYDQICDFFEKR